jgi:hypothetical protein
MGVRCVGVGSQSGRAGASTRSGAQRAEEAGGAARCTAGAAAAAATLRAGFSGSEESQRPPAHLRVPPQAVKASSHWTLPARDHLSATGQVRRAGPRRGCHLR